MGVLNKGTDFSNGDQVTDTNLDNLVDNATFTSSAVDGSTTDISGAGAIIVRDGGITSSKLATGALNDMLSDAEVTATGSTAARSLGDRFAEVINVKDFGAVGDGVTDDSTAFDAMLTHLWANYTTYFEVLLPPQMLLSKVGDFVMPPNLHLKGCGTRLYFGNQLTRLYYKRDNTQVGTVDGVDYTADGNYWGLGPNVITDVEIRKASGLVTLDEAIFVSDLIQFRTRNLSCAEAAIGIHFENDAKWTEFLDIEGQFKGSTAGILFTRTGTSTFSSFGHGRFDVILSAQEDGASGVLIQDGGSVYNSKWETRGFVAADTTEAYLFNLEDSGSDMNYSTINATIENLGNTATAYAIRTDGLAAITYVNAIFHGIGADTKFRGIGVHNIIKVIGGELLDSSDSTVSGGNTTFKIVTASTDGNGDNLYRLAEEKSIHYYLDGTVTANQKIGILPYHHSRMTVASIQIHSNTAPSGNTGSVWNIGLRKQGATNPSKVWTIADGDTNTYYDDFYSVLDAWRELTSNNLVCRSSDGTGNDGTGPTDLFVLIKYYEF